VDQSPGVPGLVAALTAAGVVDVQHSSTRRAAYSTDASLYRVVPQAVVFPRDVEELPAVLAVCRELGTPLTVRGAGTSVAGNAVGPGVVVDLSRHLGAVLDVDPQARTAVVQPGAVLSTLQRAAAPHGLRFGPDPSTQNRATLGGMIGNNACGSRALAYGRTADNVIALDLLCGNGERLALTAGGVAGVPGVASVGAGARGGARSHEIAGPATSPVLARLQELTRANLGLIRTELGRFTRQVSGYSLEHLLPEHGFDVPKMLVGTEGTCGIVLGATVRLVQAPAQTVLVALGYPDMATAGDAVPALLPFEPVALEGLDARIVQALRAQRGAGSVPELPQGQGWLFLELGGDDLAELEFRAARVVAAAGALEARVVTDPGQAALLWRIREDGAGLAGRSPAGKPAHAGWEDSAVPPERLGGYLREFDALMAQHGVTGMPYGHFGDGCLHVRIDFPLDAANGPSVFRAFLLDAAKLVVAHGGSMSGEHGDGRARSELLAQMYTPAALSLFADVKDAFDPDGVLNPGIIVRPAAVDADLRIPQARPIRAGLGLAYAHDGGDFTAAVHRCTGVGKCRADTTATGGVMCPSFLATRDERDSTRGRARVLQEMANGGLVSGGWRSPEVHQALDLCLSCKGCASDCPTGIDMAAYKAEVLHQTYRRRLRPASHYALGWLPRWARLASAVPRLVNATLGVRPLASVAKRLAGIDARRPLPEFAPRTFRQWFGENRSTATGPRGPVLLWVDTFTDHFSPQVGIAAVAVLEAAGFEVRIPDAKLCCGLTWISTGQLDAAKRILGRSVDALAPAVAAGIPVVGLEPSCTAVFRGDAPELLGPATAAGSPVAQVSAGVLTLAELLARHAPDFTVPLDGVQAVAQPHCHQHAVLGWEADAALLKGSGASVSAVGGCCGLAGNFGVERGHYDVSVAVAETALLPAVRAAGPGAVVLADGFSCRTQLEQLAGRPGTHLAELLAGRLDRR